MNLTPLQIIGIILAINGALTGATAQLTDLVGPLVAKDIVSIASLGSAILGGIITSMSGLGTQAKNVVGGGASIAVGPQADPRLATLAMDPSQSKIDAAPCAGPAVAALPKAASGT